MQKEHLIALADRSKNESKPDHLSKIGHPDPREIGEPYYYFMYLLSNEMQAKVIVELGTYVGTSIKHLAAGSPNASLLTVDVNPDAPKQVAKEPIYSNITAVVGNSTTYPWDGRTIDILFLDTEHSYNTTMANWKRWMPFVKSGGVILIDDSDLDDAMRAVITTLSETEEVIDLPGLHHTGFVAIIKR